MAQYRVDFEKGQKVHYKKFSGAKVPAQIVAVDTSRHPDEWYTIRVTATKDNVYRRGETFTTSGNWLTKR